jgi:hypothetical protein
MGCSGVRLDGVVRVGRDLIAQYGQAGPVAWLNSRSSACCWVAEPTLAMVAA